jgi:hypothetical protein
MNRFKLGSTSHKFEIGDTVYHSLSAMDGTIVGRLNDTPNVFVVEWNTDIFTKHALTTREVASEHWVKVSDQIKK